MLLFKSQFIFILLGITLICSAQIEDGGADSGVINGVAVPADFPRLIPSVNKNTAPGEIFLCNNEGPPYLLMFENDGTPAYYERLDYSARDFKMHPNGIFSYALKDDGIFTKGFVVRDNNFEPVDTISAAKGYKTDVHELIIAPNGNYLLIGVSYQTVDLSQEVVNGREDAVLKGCHIHELTSDHELVYEWECWDHFKATDAIGVDLTQKALDYVHMNSIAVDFDGHLVVSSRNLSECTKISRQTGEIIWRLGGRNNQFDWINDSLGISCQHDIRPVKGKANQYTIFDNGNYHSTPFTRVIEVFVDTSDMTVEVLWEYRHTPDIFDHSMGNAQRLENGNTLINYSNVTLPKVCEVTPDGEIVYKADLDLATHCYRSFRFSWTGELKKPFLTAERYPDHTRLIFNKFGDQTVDYYRIYSGYTADSLTLTDSTNNTWRIYSDLADSSWIYFGVSALHTDGSESAISDIAAIFSIRRKSGENLIYNGDFSFQSAHWLLDIASGVKVTGSVKDQVYELDILYGGSAYADIVLSQENISLIKGKKYRLEFDIRADQGAYFGVQLFNQDIVPTYDYSRIGLTRAEAVGKHCSYEFIMTEKTDLNARIDIQLGGASGLIYIDNVSLKEVPEPIVAELSEYSDITCYQKKDGYIRVSASGGEGNLKYRLMPASEENHTGEFSIEQGGVYAVEVHDETAQDPAILSDIRIDEPGPLNISALEITGASGNDDLSGAISVQVSGGNGEYTYTLFPDSISNHTGYFSQLDTGRYKVGILDLAGCGSILSNEILVGINVPARDHSVRSTCLLYPNPAGDYVDIKVQGNSGEVLYLQIYDSMGSMVLQREFQDELGLHLKNYMEGVYFIRIEDGESNQIMTGKLLKL